MNLSANAYYLTIGIPESLVTVTVTKVSLLSRRCRSLMIIFSSRAARVGSLRILLPSYCGCRFGLFVSNGSENSSRASRTAREHDGPRFPSFTSHRTKGAA